MSNRYEPPDSPEHLWVPSSVQHEHLPPCSPDEVKFIWRIGTEFDEEVEKYDVISTFSVVGRTHLLGMGEKGERALKEVVASQGARLIIANTKEAVAVGYDEPPWVHMQREARREADRKRGFYPALADG